MKITVTDKKNAAELSEQKITTRRERRKRFRLSLKALRRLQWRILGSVVAGFVLTILVVFAVFRLLPDQSIDTSKYQVVYLTNGQAYFGKLQNTDGEYLVMKQPYTAQAVEGDKVNPEQPVTTALLRVRDQVYGPEDSIAIRAETVAFWQNLRDDSKIAAALKAKQ